jgi:ABC-2 type transport system ATP-binding protein
MTQRAALAYALFLEPQILILDEPMSGLDPLGRQLVVDLIRDYHARGNTILFCSHVLSDVERICTRIGIMHQGRLATITTPEELRALPLEPGQTKTPLETLFLRTVREAQP